LPKCGGRLCGRPPMPQQSFDRLRLFGRQRHEASVLPHAVADVAPGIDTIAVLVLVELELRAFGDRLELNLRLLLPDERLDRAVGAEDAELGRPACGVEA